LYPAGFQIIHDDLFDKIRWFRKLFRHGQSSSPVIRIWKDVFQLDVNCRIVPIQAPFLQARASDHLLAGFEAGICRTKGRILRAL
jgi:hypothetical protein